MRLVQQESENRYKWKFARTGTHAIVNDINVTLCMSQSVLFQDSLSNVRIYL